MDERSIPGGFGGDGMDVVDVEELLFGLDCGKWGSATDERRSLPAFVDEDQSAGAVSVVQ